MLGMMLAPVLSQPDDHVKPADLADVWTFTAKAGADAQFEAAIKAHTAKRAELNDPRSWNVHVPVTGDNMSEYVIHYCCFKWADQDAYEAWSRESQVSSHFQEVAAEHLEDMFHGFARIDMENSHWGEDTVANFVGVTHWTVSGDYQAMDTARGTISSLAKEHGWDRHWAWSESIGGSDTLSLATPYANYAGMEPGEESFMAFLARHMKSEKKAMELMNSFSSNLSDSHYTIYRHRADLSTQTAD